jgi:hypothetical protein
MAPHGIPLSSRKAASDPSGIVAPMSLILGAETKAAGTPAANSDEANQLLLNGLLLSACSENETSSASTRPGRSNSHAGPPFCNTASEDDVGADRLPRDVSSGVSGYDCKRLDLLLLDEPSLGLAPILGAVRHYRSVAARGVAVLPVEQNVRAVLKLGDQRICWRWKASSHTARVGHWRRKHRQPETYLLSGPARDGV